MGRHSAPDDDDQVVGGVDLLLDGDEPEPDNGPATGRHSRITDAPGPTELTDEVPVVPGAAPSAGEEATGDDAAQADAASSKPSRRLLGRKPRPRRDAAADPAADAAPVTATEPEPEPEPAPEELTAPLAPVAPEDRPADDAEPGDSLAAQLNGTATAPEPAYRAPADGQVSAGEDTGEIAAVRPADEPPTDSSDAPPTEPPTDAPPTDAALSGVTPDAQHDGVLHRGARASAADLAMLRSNGRLRLRVAAAFVAPFVVYAVVLLVLGVSGRTFLIWIWAPTVVACVAAGALLDLAHKHAGTSG